MLWKLWKSDEFDAHRRLFHIWTHTGMMHNTTVWWQGGGPTPLWSLPAGQNHWAKRPRKQKKQLWIALVCIYVQLAAFPDCSSMTGSLHLRPPQRGHLRLSGAMGAQRNLKDMMPGCGWGKGFRKKKGEWVEPGVSSWAQEVKASA